MRKTNQALQSIGSFRRLVSLFLGLGSIVRGVFQFLARISRVMGMLFRICGLVLALWVSALNYLLLTGEAEPLKVIDPELKTARPDIVKLYEDETGWVISQHLSPMESPIKLELLDPKPVETPEGSKNYMWRARLSIDASASVFYADTKESHPLADVLRLQSGEVQLQIAYVEGKWRSETAYDVVYQGS